MLGRKGYIVDIKSTSPEVVKDIKKSLTLTPIADPTYGGRPKPIPFYLLNREGTRLALPRFFADRYPTLPAPTHTFGDVVQSPRMVFQGKLNPELHQPAAVQAALNALRERGGAILSLAPGYGKCLAPETPVLTYEGKIINAADIAIGMRLMGMDGTPRTVLGVGRGTEMMYEIRPVNGDAWRCNETHILSLRYSGHGKVTRVKESGARVVYCTQQDGTIVLASRTFPNFDEATIFATSLPQNQIFDISVYEYLKLPSSFRTRLKLFRAGRVAFAPREEPLFDPYIIGAWLGDGTSRCPSFTIVDEELVNEINRRCESHGMQLVLINQKNASRAPQYYMRSIGGGFGKVNEFTRTLKAYGILCNKHIPEDIKCGSIKTRLEVLAGLLDTDGYLAGNCFEITQKRELLANDIAFIARSLGFAASVKKVVKTCIKPDGSRVPGDYFRVNIYGDGLQDVPTILSRKRAAPRQQIKNALVTGFQCVPVGIGEYVGPMLDGDHRYLLGDFTVTHNTVCALHIACALGGKTMILVHKEFLMNQWIERIKQFVPHATVGRLQQDVVEVDRDIIVAMIHSVALKDYPPTVFEGIHTVCLDEIHHLSAPMFSRAMFKAAAPYVLGLSATPERKDGLGTAITWFAGDIVYQTERKQQTQVKVDVAYFDLVVGFQPPTTRWGKLNLAQLITDLTENKERNKLLLNIIRGYAGRSGRKLIVLSDRREHCQWLHGQLPGSGLYIGGMSEADLKASEACPVIIATYSLATEGLDIPTLDTLVLATPKSDVVQASGRILRECHGKVNNPVIVDIVDRWDVFFAQFNKRKAYYVRSGFAVPGVPAAAPSKLSQFAFIDD